MTPMEQMRRREELQRAIQRNQQSLLNDGPSFLRGAQRSRTAARPNDYPEVTDSLGNVRNREMEAAYQMGQEAGRKASLLSNDIPSVMQNTPLETTNAGIFGAQQAVADPRSYARLGSGLRSGLQSGINKLNTGPLGEGVRGANSFVDDVAGVIGTGVGSIYAGLTDPSVVQRSPDDTVAGALLKGGVGGIQSGVSLLGDAVNFPLRGAREIGMILGSSADSPYIPETFRTAQMANEQGAVRDALLKKSNAEAAPYQKAAEEVIDKNKVTESDSPEVVVAKAAAAQGVANSGLLTSPEQGVDQTSLLNKNSDVDKTSGGRGLATSLLGGFGDVLSAYGRQQANRPTLVTLDDLDKLRPITGATLMAGAKDIQTEREKVAAAQAAATRALDIKEAQGMKLSQSEVMARILEKSANGEEMSAGEREIYNKYLQSTNMFAPPVSAPSRTPAALTQAQRQQLIKDDMARKGAVAR
jgi:hypothetical protein